LGELPAHQGEVLARQGEVLAHLGERLAYQGEPLAYVGGLFARQGEPPDLEPGVFEQEPPRRTQEAEARPAPGGHERQDDRKEPSRIPWHLVLAVFLR